MMRLTVSSRSIVESSSLCTNHFGVVLTARLDRPLMRLVIDVDDPETPRVAVTPLEVVEQRPDEVATELHPLLHCFSHRAQMPTQVLDTRWILDLPINRDRRVVECRSVFGNVKRHVTIAISHPHEHSCQRCRVDLPPCFGVNAFLLVNATHSHQSSVRVVAGDTSRVIIDSQK